MIICPKGCKHGGQSDLLALLPAILLYTVGRDKGIAHLHVDEQAAPSLQLGWPHAAYTIISEGVTNFLKTGMIMMDLWNRLIIVALVNRNIPQSLHQLVLILISTRP